jgi:hypothetical protein
MYVFCERESLFVLMLFSEACAQGIIYICAITAIL